MSAGAFPPFTDPARCPKCGCDDIATHYEPQRHWFNGHGE